MSEEPDPEATTSRQVHFKPSPLDIKDISVNVATTSAGTDGSDREDGNTTPGGTLIVTSAAEKENKKKIGHRRVDPTGEVTYKRVKTSEIMGAIQLGIASSVGSLAGAPKRDLLLQDFDVVNKVVFNSEGSSTTPIHPYGSFTFKSYAPIAFRYFRDLFSIKPEDFLASVCTEPLRELSNPGASGSIFYVSQDDQFIIKTVQHKEAEFLQKLMPGYYMNLQQNPKTLLPKFFGLFCYQNIGKNIRLLVMDNLLPTTIKMHQKYDMKGSTYKRQASKAERAKTSPTLKDLDFMTDHEKGIFLEASTYDALMKTINRDCLVLEAFKIMDYSFLIGIHNLDLAGKERQERENELEYEPTTSADLNDAKGDSAHRKYERQKSVMINPWESIQADAVPIDLGDDYPTGGIPARNERGERLLIFLGIIDILQNFRLFKKIEHAWKSVLHDGDTISVHRPGFYAQRFQDFMKSRVFRKIPSLDHPEVKGTHRKFRSLVQSYMALKHSPSRTKQRSRERKSTSGSASDKHTEAPPVISGSISARPDLVPAETPEPSGITESRGLRSSGRKLQFQRRETYDEGDVREKKVERLFASSTPAKDQSSTTPAVNSGQRSLVTRSSSSENEAVQTTRL